MLRRARVSSFLLLPLTVLLAFGGEAAAQSASVDLDTERQTIRGYGGINHPTWIGDLTSAQRDTAFGNGDGQIGMTVLRMFVNESSSAWTNELATAARAQELGATIFASPWNPPASMTETVGSPARKRLKLDQYDEYTAHLNAFVDFMVESDIDLHAISVQNEPDYAEEWTDWTPTEMLNYMRDYAGQLHTRVIAPESFQYRKEMSDPILNDATALSNLDILGAHLYGTALGNFPYPLWQSKKRADQELWMTEVYTTSTADSADLWPDAINVAKNIHDSMVEAEFSAYVWWYIRRSYGMIKENGQVSKRGWCMAHYSKFVRPGYVRVEATKTPASNVNLSAYKSESGSDVVLVIMNRNGSTQTIDFSVPGTGVTSYERFTTSASKSLQAEADVAVTAGAFSITLEAQSVTTLHGIDLTVIPDPDPGTGGGSGLGGDSGSGGDASGSGGDGTGAGDGLGTGGMFIDDGYSPGSGGAGDLGDPGDGSGCTCDAAGVNRGSSGAFAAAALGFLLLLRRRKAVSIGT